jgi:eukaryotic-like serine/threonine-protein kinase
MTLGPGSRLGPYEVTAPLGEGGMGEVYKARDTRLDRIVAIKILAASQSSAPEVRQRFEREARLISQLSHPHICALHDIGREGETAFLVMEYLEGETLAARLRNGPLSLEATLRYGAEIADALEAAHRRGIVHRDLKPANVMLTRSGVKLLDFGLAKTLMPAESPVSLVADLPTEAPAVTHAGTILGTFHYMAPEQLAGRPADARADIFALGAVIFEMATGKRAFDGTTHAVVASSILTGDPPRISASQPATPPALDRVVTTCLAKDPDERWQSAGDVAKQLRWIAEGSTPAQAAAPTLRRPAARERLAWAVAGLSVFLGAALALLPRQPATPENPLRFTIPAPPGQSVFGFAQLSPDGSRLLIPLIDEGRKTTLAIRSLDSLELRRLPVADDLRGAIWSPDGREVAFFSDGRLRRVNADGGPVQDVCESGNAFFGAWNRDGTILFTKDVAGPVFAVAAAGGEPRPVTALDTAAGDVAHLNPAFLPDGTHFVYLARNADLTKSSVVLASLGSKDVRRLVAADSGAVFAEPGYLLYARDEAVFAWRFDPERLALVGSPVPALQQVHWQSSDNFLRLSAAGNRLAYLPWSLRRRLVWVDRSGRELGTLGEVGGYTDVRLSPDGRKVAVAMRDRAHGHNLDVWVLDVSRGTGTRVTGERSDEFNPAWFPDGERLVYASDRTFFYDLYQRPASGGPETILVQTRSDKTQPTVSPSGRQLLVDNPKQGAHARALIDLAAGGTLVAVSGNGRFSEEHPEISPDGRWSAFDSDESGRREVYVQPLPKGPKLQVSIGGGYLPIWNRNGSELFYAAPDGNLKSVALDLAGTRAAAKEPRTLFALRPGVGGELPFYVHPYDVSPDGSRFLVIRNTPDADPEDVVVVTNWTTILRDRR